MRRFSPLVLFGAIAVACDSPTRPADPPAEQFRVTLGNGPACSALVTPSVTSIAPPGASLSSAIGINNKGVVLGVSQPTGTFLWTAATGFHFLPVSSPNAINDLSQVVGSTDSKPVVWTPTGGLHFLPLPSGFSTGDAADISNKGLIVGGAHDASSIYDNERHPVEWVNGQPTILATSNVEDVVYLTGAQRLNDLGAVVGSAIREGYGIWMLWPNGTATSSPQVFVQPLPLGGLPTDINDRGEVTISSFEQLTLQHDAWVYEPSSGFVRINTPGERVARANAINNLGVVAGDYSPLVNDVVEAQQAYVWTTLTGMVQLPLLSGSEDGGANAINDAGQVVGRSGRAAVMWTFALTPESGLTALERQLESLVASNQLSSAQAHALDVKLQAAEQALSNHHQATAANIVRAFGLQVVALWQSHRLSDANAQALIASVACVLTSLGG